MVIFLPLRPTDHPAATQPSISQTLLGVMPTQLPEWRKREGGEKTNVGGRKGVWDGKEVCVD